PSPNCSSSSLGILGRSRKGFFLVGIHAPLTHVMPEHKISDTLFRCGTGDHLSPETVPVPQSDSPFFALHMGSQRFNTACVGDPMVFATRDAGGA
ncbi:hypothetical protein, partial [Pseudomonas entomophila]|uniref:hypothetical protein n=1 Tax=Pseudomonas entomophila TaxID=312306 RepID=UPI001C61677B